MATKPTISLVIPAYNEEGYIGTCLDFAIKNSGGRFKEIIVVDNASTDHTAKLAALHENVKIVSEPRKGTGYSRQRGLEEATGDLVAYIDADTRLSPDWLSKAEKVFATRPEVVSLSGPYHYYDGSWLMRGMMTVTWWLTGPLTYLLIGYAILGGNFIAKREPLVAMGGFDTTLAFYGDDTDTARRLSQYGKVIFKMNFFIPSSSRRFQREGFWTTNFQYAINYLWPALFGRPFTKTHQDVR